MTKTEIKIGDIVELDCPTLLNNIRQRSPIIGKVKDVFDVLFADGSEGNLEIDIQFEKSGWIRYKPTKDGGTIKVINEDFNV